MLHVPEILDMISANSDRLIYHEKVITFCRPSNPATWHGGQTNMKEFNPVVSGHHTKRQLQDLGGLRPGTKKSKIRLEIDSCVKSARQATGNEWELALTAGAMPAPLMVIRSLEEGHCTLSTSSNTLHSCILTHSHNQLYTGRSIPGRLKRQAVTQLPSSE